MPGESSQNWKENGKNKNMGKSNRLLISSRDKLCLMAEARIHHWLICLSMVSKRIYNSKDIYIFRIKKMK
jgi:hypothetical protein